MTRPRVGHLATGAAFAWRALLFCLPAGVATFAVLTVATVRASSAAFVVDARAAVVDRTATAVDACIAHEVEAVRTSAAVRVIRGRAAFVQDTVLPAQTAEIGRDCPRC